MLILAWPCHLFSFWGVLDSVIKLTLFFCFLVKREIVDLMLRSPEKLQKQVTVFLCVLTLLSPVISETYICIYYCVVFIGGTLLFVCLAQ